LWPLRHGADERILDQHYAIYFLLVEGIQHHLDSADQIIQPRPIPKAAGGRQDVEAHALEKSLGLATYKAQIDLNTLISPLAHGTEGRSE
jgi:hypothetical protein